MESKKIKLNFYNIFWIFFIGCYLGVLIETIWTAITSHILESRTALIIEPLNPVYGLGLVMFAIISNTLKNKNLIITFIACTIFGGILEFILSFFQELIFGSVSWIYNSDSLGIFERTSLIYAFLWGLLGIVYVKILEPILYKLLIFLNQKPCKIFAIILCIIISIDSIFSSLVVLRQKERKNNILPSNKLDMFFDTYYNDDLLLKIYPHMYFKPKE